MKKLFVLNAILTSFMMVLMMAPVVMADTVTIRRVSGYYTGVGGEFTLQINDNNLSPDLNWVLPLYDSKTKDIGNYDPSFQTFCVEYSEYISIGSTYNFTISDRAIQGGVGPQGDPISMGTAWVYYQFARGILAGYDYNDPTSNRDDNAGALQATLWWLENERLDPGAGNAFRNLVLAQFSNDWTLAKADNNGQYPVAVLNLYDASGLHQDQLVCTPVPEPATVFLLGSGLLGLAGFARRKFKK